MATDGDWQVAQARNERANVKAYWNERAKLGERAGTDDLILVELERRAIRQHIRDGYRVLDVGCGTGGTLLELCKEFAIEANGIDSSPEMIRAAVRELAVHGGETNKKSSLGVFTQEVLSINADWHGLFDVVYTQRCLINLSSWREQKRAIENICSLLKPGGRYVMCESSQDGLDWINELRKAVGLAVIERPWHNVYIQDKDIERLAVEGAKLERIEEFSGLYYLASRVFNAAIAAEHGTEPSYDAGINRLALKLPNMGLRGQSRIWIIKRSP